MTLLSHASVEVKTKLNPWASVTPETALWVFWDRISASGTQSHLDFCLPNVYAQPVPEHWAPAWVPPYLWPARQNMFSHCMKQFIACEWTARHERRKTRHSFLSWSPEAQESYLRQMESLPFHTWHSWGILRGSTQAYIPPGHGAVLSKPHNLPCFQRIVQPPLRMCLLPVPPALICSEEGPVSVMASGEMSSVLQAYISAFTWWDLKISCMSPYHPLFKVTLSLFPIL